MSADEWEDWAERVFCLVWRVLARRGKCDAWGSAEQRRVHEEWLNDGRDQDVATFILLRANLRGDDK